MKALAITLVWIVSWTLIASCSAEYQSPRTGIKYRFEIPVEAFEKHLNHDK